MAQRDQIIREYKDRLRILIIIYFFSESYNDPRYPSRKKLLKGEIKIQKIDFLLRYPDYFSFELLKYAEKNKSVAGEIKSIVRKIFNEDEPELRKHEMQRLFFGAYEDIDDVIAFLKSINFIEFSSKTSVGLTTVQKHYYLTQRGLDRIENQLSDFDYLDWYVERCKLIRKYFGNKSGTDLKKSQYEIEEYRKTSLKEYIQGIENKVRDKFEKLFGEKL